MSDENVTQGEDWLGGESVSNELPRFAIGDPGSAADEEDAAKILIGVEGVYEDSIAETFDGKMRLLHRIKPRELINGDEETRRILLWGNHNIDGSLPCLSPGTKVRITFLGKQKIKGGKTLKKIKVEWPPNAKMRPHPYANKQSVSSDGTPF